MNNTIERINERDTNGNKATNFIKQTREGYYSDHSLTPYRNTGLSSNFMNLTHSELDSATSNHQSTTRGR